MQEKYSVECSHHGPQEAAFVCRHIVAALSSGEPVGFYQADDPESTHPDAWCAQCEEVWEKCGGEWTEEVEKALGVTMICASCYERAMAICRPTKHPNLG